MNEAMQSLQGEERDELVPEAPGMRQPALQPERLQASYRLTARDVRKSYFQALARHPRQKRSLLIYFVLLPVFLGVVGWMAVAPLFGVAWAVAMWIALIFYVPWELARKTMRQHGARGTQSFSISPENVTGRSEGIAESKIDWGFVEKVTDSADYIAFHWKSGRTGIVPKRAFPDAETAARFAQAAAAWHAAASRSGTATGSELTPTHQSPVDAPREPEGRQEVDEGQTEQRRLPRPGCGSLCGLAALEESAPARLNRPAPAG